MKQKLNKGSLTVEAALVLPIFIFAILFISYFIKVIYIQENIQHALDQTATHLATYAYAYDKVELKDLQQQAYKKYSKESEDIKEDVYGIIESGIDIFYDIHNIWNLGEAAEEPGSINELNGADDLSGLINNYSSQVTQIMSEIKGTVSNLISNITNLGQGINIILNHKDEVLAYGKKDGFEYIINTIGMQSAKTIFKSYINDDSLKNYYVVNGFKGLNFSNSQFMLENDHIDLVVTYKLELPIPIKIINNINLIQRVKVRAWTGYNYENNIEDDNLEEVFRVYVSKSAIENELETIYHTNELCRYINIQIIVTAFKEVKERDPCNVCADEDEVSDEDIVYVTNGGRVYHMDENCFTINRTISYLPLEELVNPRECKTCAN
ncbi:TadE-like protein [Natranaerovirga pectinivora]|uniref:TadE-like protein n=1 Tax=Natranaerovirga pectinivora TaxID=682400 RepID=A0A4V2UZK2_9FIRM|nr:TadE family protein [Natranaerovirga pectinivora]TCT11648.1 TadE-like protein [Natranaerovirga pectinivora]